jgi:hypothetical protein
MWATFDLANNIQLARFRIRWKDLGFGFPISKESLNLDVIWVHCDRFTKERHELSLLAFTLWAPFDWANEIRLAQLQIC